ncbi:hypothetical protein PVL29_001046 [Vitis rotundifolia]|uniref:Uncharacterized protein n=1 Tax=Vitis rotundifolia TaxID=103349 RepID=A0AA39AKL5_VITRO|nr:hypothetical protein PVL29_001046 [Vitis rotundifolia]
MTGDMTPSMVPRVKPRHVMCPRHMMHATTPDMVPQAKPRHVRHATARAMTCGYEG